MKNLYAPSYARMGPYIVGVFTGYLLYRWKCKCRIPKVGQYHFILSPHTPAFNSFPNTPLFLRACSASLLKILWEEENLLITSNFSFSHNVFYPSGELSTIFLKYNIVICKLFHFWNLSFGKELNNPQKENFQTHSGKRRKCGYK